VDVILKMASRMLDQPNSPLAAYTRDGKYVAMITGRVEIQASGMVCQ
jgi:hypothetical protein